MPFFVNRQTQCRDAVSDRTIVENDFAIVRLEEGQNAHGAHQTNQEGGRVAWTGSGFDDFGSRSSRLLLSTSSCLPASPAKDPAHGGREGQNLRT